MFVPGDLAPVDVSEQWEDLRMELVSRRCTRVYVMGEPDSGKTSLCRFLVGALAEHVGAASYLDCDPGQSTIGPPSTIGLERADGSVLLRFAGSTSPRGYLLQNARAIAHLARLAGREHPMVIDSSGYVTDDAAREFQYTIIDLLRPQIVVALGSSAAVESVCRSFRRSASVRSVPVSRSVQRRSTATRRAYREARFGEYFRSATEVVVQRSSVGLIGRVPNGPGEQARGRLVGVLDEDQLLLSLGLVVDARPHEERIIVLAKPIDPRRVCSLQFSHMRVDRSGRELYVE
jgi:polynucleotide 5'-hydroxyl-kinase GRC3/NOL9